MRLSMYSMKSMRFLVFFGLCILAFALSKCQNNPLEVEEPITYASFNDSVGYVGMQTCRGCHTSIYDSYIETGMGKSFEWAHRAKSALPTEIPLLYDSILNLYYQPEFKGDSLFLKEFRLDGKDTSNRLNTKVNYIIGSGQHTNSHLYSEGEYVHQMPFTWYTQKGKLDLPPGFENGSNSRFNRLIGLECMSCHNAMPTEFVLGSENKFEAVGQGIDCERCHGPGEAHIAKIQRGEITDTSKYIDFSIVNPKKLSAELQMEICQRCHLQGNAVLKPGKTFFDFRPGKHLNEVMEIYMPRPNGENEAFIMAGHIQRFKMSECYLQSEGEFVCTSCHNPHISVQKTNAQHFNNQCQSCHTKPKIECNAPAEELNKAENNCVSCHMPQRGSADIPHVSVHDHYIRVPSLKALSNPSVELGLYAVNQKNPDKLSRLKAYLQQYERFDNQPVLLDSAQTYLGIDGWEGWMAQVHYYFLRGQNRALVDWSLKKPMPIEMLQQQSFDNRFAWTAYRLAVAWKEQEPMAKKEIDGFFRASIQAAPFVLSFRSAYAAYLLTEENLDAAREQYRWMYKENNRTAEAMNGLGYIAMLEGNLAEAEKYLNRCIEFHPDYLLARINRLVLNSQKGKTAELQTELNQLKKLWPNHPKVLALSEYISTL